MAMIIIPLCRLNLAVIVIFLVLLVKTFQEKFNRLLSTIISSV